jgi:hypothetical protein
MNNAATDNVTEIVKSRAVHSAMAATVQAAGLDVAREIYETARQFNDQFFGGMLTALLVEITAPASPRALATHEPRTPEGVDCVIRIAPSVVADGPLTWKDVLLHEMIHVWQTEADKREPGYAGHGPEFAAKCNEIGAKLGLGQVGVKGRGGLPDCAQWPLNVRPAGYYGESTRGAKVARKSSGKAPRTRKPRAASAPVSAPSKVDAAVALVLSMTPEERQAFVAALVAAGSEAA